MARLLLVSITVAALSGSAATAHTEPGGFRWDGERWGSYEGEAFARHLLDRGVNPKSFKRKHPELVKIFEYRINRAGKRAKWPPPIINAERRIAKRLDSVLCRFGGMCGTGWSYVRSSKRWNVNPFYLVGISAIESSVGVANCGPYNAWGIIAYCGRGFASWAAGIEYEARLIRTMFINHGLTDPWSIGRYYCPPCGDRHGTQAAAFMRQFFRSGPGVYWRDAVAAVR